MRGRAWIVALLLAIPCAAASPAGELPDRFNASHNCYSLGDLLFLRFFFVPARTCWFWYVT